MNKEHTEFTDFLVTMRLVEAVHGKSSKAVRYTAGQLLNRFKTIRVREMCKNISSSLFAYDTYIAIEKRIERV